MSARLELRRALPVTLGLTFAALAGVGCPSPPAEPPQDAHDTIPAASADAAPGPVADASTTPAAGGRIYDEKTQLIVAHVGETFTLALAGNATTGYQWMLDPPPDAAILTGGTSKYTGERPPNCDHCVGFGGTFRFDFAAVGAGTTTLHFVYIGPGRAPPPPDRKVTIEVRVSPAS